MVMESRETENTSTVSMDSNELYLKVSAEEAFRPKTSKFPRLSIYPPLSLLKIDTALANAHLVQFTFPSFLGLSLKLTKGPF